jgi:hypothetical protein
MSKPTREQIDAYRQSLQRFIPPDMPPLDVNLFRAWETAYMAAQLVPIGDTIQEVLTHIETEAEALAAASAALEALGAATTAREAAEAQLTADMASPTIAGSNVWFSHAERVGVVRPDLGDPRGYTIEYPLPPTTEVERSQPQLEPQPEP